MFDNSNQVTGGTGIMRQTFFKLVLSLTICLSASVNVSGQDGEDASQTDFVKTVRVLTIGNSFAQNACRYLKEIASDGSVDLTIGTANLGGCTLERHATLAKQFADDSTTRPYSRITDTGQTKLSLQEYLEVEKWDYVTLQQMSALSFQPESYQPYVNELAALIRTHAPQAKILIHETWAYRADSPILQEQSLTQAEMYERLSAAYREIAAVLDATIIPVGTAFQKARTSQGREVIVPDPNYDFDNPVYPKRPNQKNSLVAGWYWDVSGDEKRLRLDFKHANVSGCYLAGLVWYEKLTGNDARNIKYVPKGVKDPDAAFLREVAHEVVQEQDATRSDLTSDEKDECRRETFSLDSNLLERDVQVRVVLPPGYSDHADRTYPIVYCLHGMGAPFATFSEMTELRKHMKDNPVILAMFDGGVASFYLDAIGDGKVDKTVLYREPKESDKLGGDALSEAEKAWQAIPQRIPSRYTSFFFQELVPAVDQHYRVDGRNRAVTGFSMGGFGAMHLMLEKPEFFRSVSGLSSAFYSRERMADPSRGRRGFFTQILGEYSADSPNYDVAFQFDRIQKAVDSGIELPPIYQHCGTEDRLISTNEKMAEHLKKLGCSIEFRASPGGHDWEFWRDSAPAMLDFHMQHFTR